MANIAKKDWSRDNIHLVLYLSYNTSEGSALSGIENFRYNL